MSNMPNNNDDLTRKKQLNFHFNKINNFFEKKKTVLYKYKNFSFEEILANAPKYYSLIRVVERLNNFITKDEKWLSNFVKKNHIRFDWQSYEVWKAGKQFNVKKYDNTQAPSKWIYSLQDYLIDLLESLQILLTMEFYLDENDFKEFLKKNRTIDFRMRANFVKPSPPSEGLDILFAVLDELFEVDFKYDFKTHLIVDTTLCLQIYRRFDELKVFELLRRKEFYMKYRLEFLKGTTSDERREVPYESDIITIGEDFLKTLEDFRYAFQEYKTRLIEKASMAKRKTYRF